MNIYSLVLYIIVTCQDCPVLTINTVPVGAHNNMTLVECLNTVDKMEIPSQKYGIFVWKCVKTTEIK